MIDKIEAWAEKNDLRVYIALGFGPLMEYHKYFVYNPKTMDGKNYTTAEMLELMEGKK